MKRVTHYSVVRQGERELFKIFSANVCYPPNFMACKTHGYPSNLDGFEFMCLLCRDIRGWYLTSYQERYDMTWQDKYRRGW